MLGTGWVEVDLRVPRREAGVPAACRIGVRLDQIRTAKTPPERSRSIPSPSPAITQLAILGPPSALIEISRRCYTDGPT